MSEKSAERQGVRRSEVRFFTRQRRLERRLEPSWRRIEREIYLSEAWKEDPEFQNALHIAVVVGKTDPLVEYLAANKPLSSGNKRALAGLLQLQEKQIASLQNRPVGRPRRQADTVSDIEQAERNAAWLLAITKAAWRKELGHKRVPKHENDKMAEKCMKEAARAVVQWLSKEHQSFDIDRRAKKLVSRMNKDNVLNALKTGHIVVDN
jgi:hypothetical protein